MTARVGGVEFAMGEAPTGPASNAYSGVHRPQRHTSAFFFCARYDRLGISVQGGWDRGPGNWPKHARQHLDGAA
jgi:hypothetical protein